MLQEVLDLLCSSSVLCIPSSRNIPLTLIGLSVLARGLYSLFRRTASHMWGAVYSLTFISSESNYSYRTTQNNSSFNGGSGILWNSLGLVFSHSVLGSYSC